MEETGFRLENKKSYQALLSIGGALAMLVGGYHLFGFAPQGNDFFPNWLLGLLFLGFGTTAWISLLDQIHTTVFEDRIVIKSLFRKRVILKKEIVGYGLEDYEHNSKQRQRIMIIAKGQRCKFITEQVADISAVKRFLKGQEVLPNAFYRDNLLQGIVIGLVALTFVVPIALSIFYENPSVPTGEGRVVFETPIDLTIVSEEEDELRFALEGYEAYLFTVSKANLFVGFKAARQRLILVFEDQALAERITNDENPASSTRAIQEVYVKALIPIK